MADPNIRFVESHRTRFRNGALCLSVVRPDSAFAVMTGGAGVTCGQKVEKRINSRSREWPSLGL